MVSVNNGKTLFDVNALVTQRFQTFTHLIEKDKCYLKGEDVAPKGSVYPKGSAGPKNLVKDAYFTKVDTTIPPVRYAHHDHATVVTNIVNQQPLAITVNDTGEGVMELSLQTGQFDDSFTKQTNGQFVLDLTETIPTNTPFFISFEYSYSGDVMNVAPGTIRTLNANPGTKDDRLNNINALLNSNFHIPGGTFTDLPDGFRRYENSSSSGSQNPINCVVFSSSNNFTDVNGTATVSMRKPFIKVGVERMDFELAPEDGGPEPLELSDAKGILFRDISFIEGETVKEESLIVEASVLEGRLEIKPTNIEKEVLQNIKFR